MSQRGDMELPTGTARRPRHDEQDSCQEELKSEDLKKKYSQQLKTKHKKDPRSANTTDDEEVTKKSSKKPMKKQNYKRGSADFSSRKADDDCPKNHSHTQQHQQKKEKIHLNVGGRRFVVDQSTLLRVPNSRLYKLAESHCELSKNPTANTTISTSSTCPEFSFTNTLVPGGANSHPQTTKHDLQSDILVCKEYFFDRHPDAFEMILSYYRTGQLHSPMNMCGPMFQEELQYWGINENLMEMCCWNNYSTYHNAEKTFANLVKNESTDESDDEEEQGLQRLGKYGEIRGSGYSIHSEDSTLDNSCWSRIGRVVQEAFDKPGSPSPISMGLAMVSIIIRIISVMLMALQTLPVFRVKDRASVVLTVNYTVEALSDEGRLVSEFLSSTDPHPWITICEIAIVVYFSLELVCRFIFSKSKVKFVRKPLNWVDLVALLCSIAEVFVDIYHFSGSKNLWIQMLDIPKIFRLFRLTRFMRGLRILLYTARASMRELFLMVVIFFIFVIFFGTAMFFVEQLVDSATNQVRTLPHAYWWALVTMTTLGYGDIVPQTAPGYVLGILCALNGVLVIALPVPIVINNFALFYSHEVARRSMPKDRRRQLYRQNNDKQQQQQQQLPVKALMLTKHTAPGVAGNAHFTGSAAHF